MLIKNSDTHKFSVDDMNEDELNAFVFFLESERERHLEDIIDIEKLILKVKKLQEK